MTNALISSVSCSSRRLGQHARRQEERHGLRERQRQRRQEGGLEQSPLAVLAPDGQIGVELHRFEVAIDGADGHAELVGNVLGADAGRVAVQDRGDAQVAGCLVPLGSGAIAVEIVHQGWVPDGLSGADGEGADDGGVDCDGAGVLLTAGMMGAPERYVAARRAVIDACRPLVSHASPG